MPLKTFTCPQCGAYDLLLGRNEYDSKTTDTCPECGAESPANKLPLPARRNPQHGIQK